MICNKKLFLFDIDGVIKLGDNIIDGAIDLYEQIRKVGGKSIFITNNSTKSVSSYVELFKKYGFKNIDESNFLTALTVTKKFLKNRYGNKLIYAWGTQSFIDELNDYGLNVTTNKDDYGKIDAIIVGYNNELTYKSLCDICEVLQRSNAEYFATNIDWICPVTFGFIPDCGGICKLISLATGKMPTFLGKPEPNMVQDALLENSQYTREQCVVIGDRLYTDIACGIKSNVDSCVVFTGEATRDDMKTTEFQATYKYNSVKEIYIDLKNGNNACEEK